MWSILRLCNEEQLRLRQNFETAVRRVGDWCGLAASLGVSQLEQCMIYEAVAGQ
jgi:hypothetical protein